MPIKKKRTRPPRSIANPEYVRWQKDQIHNNPNPFGLCHEDVFPEDYGKVLPPEGAWVLMFNERLGRARAG